MNELNVIHAPNLKVANFHFATRFFHSKSAMNLLLMPVIPQTSIRQPNLSLINMAVELGQFHELMKISSLGNLPNEIMIDILLRLPVKSICRFKCASKPWKTLFHNQKFVELHLARVLAGNSDCLLLRYLANSEEEIYMVEWDETTKKLRKWKVSTMIRKEIPWIHQFPPEGVSLKAPTELFSLRSKETLEELLRLQVPLQSKTGYYTIVNSCNGLVCLTESNEEGLVPFLNAYLWNPTTQEIRTLPRYHTNRFTGQVVVAGFGFMFHPEVKDYLVVRIMYLADSESYEVEMYSLSTNQWKMINAELKCNFQESLSQVFVNRALHWLVTKGEKITDQRYFVLSFDVEEKFTEIRLPEGQVMNEFLLHKTPNGPNSSAESLSLIISKFFEAHDIWVLKEYGNADSWYKLYSVRFRELPMRPLRVLDENRILMERDDTAQVVLCDSWFRIMKEIDVYKPVRVVSHIESLVSPYQGNEDLGQLNWLASRDLSLCKDQE